MAPDEAEYELLDRQERNKASPRGLPGDGREQSLAIRETRVRRLLYLNSALVVVAFCYMVLIVLPERLQSPSMLKCAKLLSPASPLLDSLEFWEGDFVNYFNHSTIYRGPPSEELENAWLRLWDQPPIGVDDAIVASLNKTNDANHYEVIGSDPEQPTYAAIVQVFHQLRCLNLLRQGTWPLSYFDESWGEHTYPYDFTEDVSRRLHLDHCIETLRLSLMCYGDTTPVLLNHRTGHKIMRELDFNVHHKCRNFDQIIAYAQKNRVYVEDLGDDIS